MSERLRLSEMELTRIGLGTNRLRNTPQNQAFIREAVAAGVNFIDTAHTYTGGDSERTIASALGGRDDWAVATKGGWNSGRADALDAEIDESLRRLRSDTIDLYYLHRVDAETPVETSVTAIEENRARGRIRHIGISNVSVEQIERARKVAPIAAVQNHYNLSEHKSEEVIDYCTEAGILFVPFFPLRGSAGPALAEIASNHGASPEQIALAWLLKRSPMMMPIPGTLSIDHVRQNLAALEIELTDDEFEALR